MMIEIPLVQFNSRAFVKDYHVEWDNCGLKWSRENDFDSKD